MHFVAVTRLPTEMGRISTPQLQHKGQEHFALTFGEIGGSASVLLRVHSEWLTGDAFFSQRCDCVINFAQCSL